MSVQLEERKKPRLNTAQHTCTHEREWGESKKVTVQIFNGSFSLRAREK